MISRLENWPKNYVSAFTIGIDDIHPECSENGCDCGGDLEEGALRLLVNLLESHPQIKVTLFITPDWIFKPQRLGIRFIQRHISRGGLFDRILTERLQRTWSHGQFRIDDKRYEGWRAFLKGMASSGKFNLAFHGLHHFQSYVRYPCEFLHADSDKCRLKLRTAKELFDKTGLPYTMGFAPPGWGVTENLIDALVKENFNYIAGCADAESPVSPKTLCNGAGIKGVPLYFPSIIKGKLMNIPRNWDLEGSSIERAKQIIEIGGLIGVHGHIADNYHGNKIGNGVTPENVKHLDELICFLEQNYPNKIWFTTFNDLATDFKTP